MNALMSALVFSGHLISWSVILGVPLLATFWLLEGLAGARPPYPMWDLLAAILIIIFLHAALLIGDDKGSDCCRSSQDLPVG